MAHLLVKQNLEDYAKWKELFDGDSGIREASGSKGAQVFQNVSDPNEVFVIIEWDSMENLQQFAQSDELKERMQRAGHTGPPAVYFVNLTDSTSF
jgi:heme-degrading monooxygenase HmoA